MLVGGALVGGGGLVADERRARIEGQRLEAGVDDRAVLGRAAHLIGVHQGAKSPSPQPSPRERGEGGPPRSGRVRGRLYTEAACNPGKTRLAASNSLPASVAVGYSMPVGCGLQLAADAGDGFGRIDDRDACMAAEDEEIGIAGDDQIGLRRGCEGQYLVVRGIAADRDRQWRRIDDLR